MRWSRAIYGLTVVVVIAGLVALWGQLSDAGPAGRGPTFDAWWKDALRQPQVAWLGLTWLGTTAAAWVLDLWGWGWGVGKQVGSERLGTRRSGESQAGEPGGQPNDASRSPDQRPASAPRPALHGGETPAARADELRRLKLEAFLRGRPDARAFVDHLLTSAQDAGASDIHLQVVGEQGTVTFRTRGELRTVARYAHDRHAEVVRRLKIMAELPPYVSRTPQDGSFVHGDLDVRLSCVPAAAGERMALRLAGDASLRALTDLGFAADDLERWRRLLTAPQGLIVLTGPTGSGKTTTLYSALAHIHEQRGERVAISSIEDPVEVALPFVHQVGIDRARGVAFATALRAVLRQDPNVLMIGEIRDPETARVAIQAGLSGHLILTTLHADSALGIFPRLIDLGAEPFLAASATVAAVAQRLVPRLCPHCKHPRTLERGQRELLSERLARHLAQRPEAAPSDDLLARFGSVSHVAAGCERCQRRGTEGQRAIFEIIEVDPTLRRQITARSAVDDVRHAAAAAPGGWQPLAERALGLAADGEISLQDALEIA